jgi:endonuclease YncB( thermonuclease family)
LCACLAQAEILSGKVVKIADGDTLTLLDRSKQQHKVRLTGIDALERKQPFGTVSGQNLATLVFWQDRCSGVAQARPLSAYPGKSAAQ